MCLQRLLAGSSVDPRPACALSCFLVTDVVDRTTNITATIYTNQMFGLHNIPAVAIKKSKHLTSYFPTLLYFVSF